MRTTEWDDHCLNRLASTFRNTDSWKVDEKGFDVEMKIRDFCFDCEFVQFSVGVAIGTGTEGTDTTRRIAVVLTLHIDEKFSLSVYPAFTQVVT